MVKKEKKTFRRRKSMWPHSRSKSGFAHRRVDTWTQRTQKKESVEGKIVFKDWSEFIIWMKKNNFTYEARPLTGPPFTSIFDNQGKRVGGYKETPKGIEARLYTGVRAPQQTRAKSIQPQRIPEGSKDQVKMIRKIIKQKCKTLHVRIGRGTAWGWVEIYGSGRGGTFAENEKQVLRNFGLSPGNNFAVISPDDREKVLRKWLGLEKPTSRAQAPIPVSSKKLPAYRDIETRSRESMRFPKRERRTREESTTYTVSTTVKPDRHRVRLSRVQQTLLDQLRGLNPLFIGDYGIKAILTIANGMGVRLHSRNRGKVINFDIVYDRGQDLYDLKAFRVNELKASTGEIDSWEGAYVEDLHPFIRRVLDKEAP